MKLFLSPAFKLSQLLGYCDRAAMDTGVENLCVISDLYSEVELPGHAVFIFWDALTRFPRDDTILHSHQPCTQLPISRLPHTYLLSKQVCDSPTVALIDTSCCQSKSHIFHIPVGICVSNLEKCLFKSLAHITIRLLFLLSCRSFLYISVIELLGPFVWSNSLIFFFY